MPKRLGILGLVAVLALGAASLATRGGEPSGPPPPPAAPLEDSEPASLVGSPPLVEATPHEGVVITGRVIRLPGHVPVEEATIVLRVGTRELARTHAASDGRFRLQAEPPDADPDGGSRAVLVASAEGLTTMQAIAPSREVGDSCDVGDLVLEPALTIRGVVRGEDGECIAGARVAAEPSDAADDGVHRAGAWAQAALRQHVVTDEEGNFEFAGLPPRLFDVEVRAEGYVSSWYGGSAVADAAFLDVRLLRGQSARVRVVDMDGKPVVGARVNLYLGYRTVFAGHYKTHLRLDRSTMSDPDGRCILTGLRDRNHVITAQSHGLAGADTYVLPGWSETVVKITPGWRSTRYVFEGGPGGGSWGLSPPGSLEGDYAWVRWPPEPEEEATPAVEEPAAPAEAEEPPEPEAEEAPEERPPVPADRARLHLTVLSADGVPMPRTYLGFEGPEEEGAITEEDGTEIISLAPGRYAVRVSPLDFGTPVADVHETVDAQGGVESRFVFRMPLVYSVPVVVQSSDGVPVPRAEVEILRDTGTKRTWADGQGRVFLFAERGQPFSLLSRSDGDAAAFLDDIELPTKGPVNLRAAPSTSLQGRVLGPDGAPVFGAWVKALREGLGPVGEEKWMARTDDGGGFVLEGPTQARYRVTAGHRAFGAATVSLEVGPHPEALTFHLTPLARLRGRIVDEAGEPISGAEIALRDRGGEREYGWVGSGDDGRFEITLPYGDARAELVVERDGFTTKEVPVSQGAPGALEIRLEPR